MANKNLFPKDTTAVKTAKVAAKTKAVGKPKTQDAGPEEPSAPPESKQQMAKAKPSKGTKKIRTTALAVKKLSMVDAALQILAKAKEPMTCKDLVEAMTTKGLWSSPKGKTPANTLYSAFLRLLQKQGKAAPIRKADKGTFEVNLSATA
jgi:hypothetical protein